MTRWQSTPPVAGLGTTRVLLWPNVQDERVKSALCPADLAFSPKISKSLVCLLPHGGILEEGGRSLALFHRGDRMYKRTTGPWPKGIKEEVGSMETTGRVWYFLFLRPGRSPRRRWDGGSTSLFEFSSHLSTGTPWLENLWVPSPLALTASGHSYWVLQGLSFSLGSPCFSLLSSLVKLGLRWQAVKRKDRSFLGLDKRSFLSPVQSLCVKCFTFLPSSIFTHFHII